jgi:hypothetical protein
MTSTAEEFILDVRKAVRLEQKPTFITDSQLIDADTTARALPRATKWLTPKIVQVYDPNAFKTWPDTQQSELRDGVEKLRAITAAVSPDKPVTSSQFKEGIQAFDRLKTAVQKMVCTEWQKEASGLIAQVEGWAAENKWVTRRAEKKLTETLIGDYSLDQLYMHAEGNLYILDPIARFVHGGLGSFDLSIQPSFFTTSIYREMDDQWYIRLHVGQRPEAAKKELFTKDSLAQAVVELRSLL